jgi:hypothetical protein
MAVNEQDDATTGMLTPPKAGEVLFEGNAKSLKVGKPLVDVNAHQLIEEVYAHLGDRERFEVVLTDDGTEHVVHVLGDADMDGVRAVVKAHTADPHYGMSDEARKVEGLRERLRSGEDLPQEDLNTLLRAML